MTILYTNGCSYTAHVALQEQQRYPSLVAKHFGWELKDASVPGSCNSKIIRTAMRDCINLLDQEQPIVALVQLTHHNRLEYAGDITQQNCWKYNIDLTDPKDFDIQKNDMFESINPLDESNWPTESRDYFKHAFVLQKDKAIFNNLFHGVIGLTSFFQKHNIRYLVYAGPIYMAWNFKADPFYQYLLRDPGVLDLYKFSMLGLTGSTKHPSETGMQQIADHMISLLA